MQILVLWIAVISLVSAGCKKTSAKNDVKSPGDITVTPAEIPSGRVSLYNQNANFVVVTFSPGQVPTPGKRIGIYRNGLKVAEGRVTGPARDLNTVADISAGEPRIGDDVRPN